MENVKNIRLNMSLALVVFMVIANFVLRPSFIVVQAICLGFSILIYLKFAESVRKFLYYNVVIFAVVHFSMTYTLKGGRDIYFFYIMLVFYYVYVMFENKFRLPSFMLKNKYSIFLLIFVSYMIFSLIISTNRVESLKVMINYLFMISFLVMVVIENTSKKDLSQFLRLSSLFYFVTLILGTIEIFGIKYNLRNHYLERGITAVTDPSTKRIPVVFFYNPNNYAMVLVIGMIITVLYFLYSDSKKEKMFCTFIYLLALTNLIFTTSRGGWSSIIISLVFGSLVFLFLKEKNNWKIILVVTALTLGIFYVASIIPHMSSTYDKFKSTPIVNKIAEPKSTPAKSDGDLATIGAPGSINVRVTILYDIVKGVIVKGHVFGFGVGNTYYYLESMNNTHGIFYPHSLWFELLGDYGIPICIYSILIYLSLMLDALACYKRHKSKYYMFAFISLFAFIFLAFDPSTVLDLPIFYLFIAMSVVPVKNEKTINLS